MILAITIVTMVIPFFLRNFIVLKLLADFCWRGRTPPPLAKFFSFYSNFFRKFTKQETRMCTARSSSHLLLGVSTSVHAPPGPGPGSPRCGPEGTPPGCVPGDPP